MGDDGKLKVEVEKLKAEVRELKRADKLKDEFMDVVSHELKTPLIPIMGYIEIWAEEGLDEQLKKKSLEVVKRNAVRLKHLIDDILLISKMESGKLSFVFKPLDLGKELEAVAERFQEQAKQKSIALHVESREGISVEADKDRVRDVLDNLVDNAIKFTPNKGEVWLLARAGNGKATIEVRDSGVGIKEEYREKVFEKFFQVDSSASREFGGTGLGLDICKTIVEKHGGRIWCESTPPIGTTFFVELPAKQGGKKKS